MSRRIAAGVVALLGSGACSAPEAPVEPSWQVDVMPLFAANCVRCHGYPFRGDGASALRLDTFDDVDLADGNVASGAARSIQRIFRFTHSIALLPNQRPMPPDRPLDEYELAVIRNWANLGNGDVAVRGPGRPDNHAPELAITEVARAAASITFAYDLRDLDRDLVVGAVIGPRQKEDGGTTRIDPRAVIGNVVAGRGTFVWDITGVEPGDYTLAARLDDGADVDPDGGEDYLEVELGSVTITAP